MPETNDHRISRDVNVSGGDCTTLLLSVQSLLVELLAPEGINTRSKNRFQNEGGVGVVGEVFR